MNCIALGQINSPAVDNTGNLYVAKCCVCIFANILSLCRTVDHGKGITGLQAFDSILICRSIPGNRSGDRIAGLVFSVVIRYPVMDSNVYNTDFARICYGQRSGVPGDDVIARIVAKIQGVCIVRFADFRLAAGHGKCGGIPGSKRDGAGLGCSCGKRAAYVLCPVAVRNLGAVAFYQFRSVIRFAGIRCADSNRQRFNDQETVACVENNGIIGIIEDCFAVVAVVMAHFDIAADNSLLLCSGKGISASVLFLNQGLSGRASCQSIADHCSVFALKCSIVDRHIGSVCQLGGIGETGAEYFSGVIVGAGSAGMGIPLVSGNDYIDTSRLHSQGARNIYDIVICSRGCITVVALSNLQILRGGGTGTRIRLCTFKAHACNRVASRIAGDHDRFGSIIRIIDDLARVAEQWRSVVDLGLRQCRDNQLLLVIDVDDEVAFCAGNIIGKFCRFGIFSDNLVRMMEDPSFRRLILQRECVACLHVGSDGRSNALAVHIQVVHSDPG